LEIAARIGEIPGKALGESLILREKFPNFI
jgi:hypothetical protein